MKKDFNMRCHHGLKFRVTAWILMTALLAAVLGCAPKPVHVPAPDADRTDPRSPALLTAARVETLEAEAKKFMEMGAVKQALENYHQALALNPEEPQKARVIAGIEQALALAEPELIQDFLAMPGLAIPEPLLVYWLGVNLAQNEAYPEALSELTRFVDNWPDHPRAPDSRELIGLIRATAFKKDTIGCLLPLSGKYSVYGQRALKGIQLAVQEIAHTHGRRFNIIVKDTQGDPATAAAAVDELNRANVAGIIGPLLAVDSAGARAQELKIPLIALTQRAEFPLSGEYLFSNFITPQMQVQALAAYVFKALGLQKVGILYPDEPYGRRHMQLFSEAVAEYGGQVTGTAAYDGGATDFSDPIRKITGEFYAGKNPEQGASKRISIDFQALFIPDSVARINMILPQLAFHDARGMVLLGTNLWHHPSLLAQTKGYNRQTVITDGYFGQSLKPAAAQFEKAFTGLYGESPGFLEAVFYDTAKILFLTAMDPTVNSRQRLKDALLEERIFEGATGRTIFDATGAARKELFLITIENNRFVEIYR